jgi:hypothetical protein
MWTGLILFRIGPVAHHCEHDNEPSFLYKMLRISWVGEQLVVSQEGLSYMELDV